MGKHRVIRGLPDHLRKISIEVARDLDSDTLESKARIQALREAMSRDDFYILCKAAKGNGPRLMQERHGGTTVEWRLRISRALGFAYRRSEDGIRRQKHLNEVYEIDL